MPTSKISTASGSPVVPAAALASTSATSAASATGSALRGDAFPKNRLPYLYAASVLLSAIALGVSGYLSYVAFTSSKIAGCGGGLFDCEHVLTSKWSNFMGLPVAAWASSLYLSVLLTLAVTARWAMSRQATPLRQWSWTIVTTAGVAAGCAAVWFIYLQVFVLKHLCPWCLTAHTCGLLLCLATLWASPLARRTKVVSAVFGLAATVMLATAQSLAPAPPSFHVEEFETGAGAIEDAEMFNAPGEGEEIFMAPDAAANDADSAKLHKRWPSGEVTEWAIALTSVRSASMSTLLTAQVSATGQSQGNAAAASSSGQQSGANQSEDKPAERTIHLSGANVKLRVNQWPILGSPDAKHIFVELFDYTCPHCRATQRAVRGAREQLKNDLAVIVLPVPLDQKCNDTVQTQHPNHRDSCEISRIALALWKADPAKFPEFHEWLLSVNPLPTAASAKAKAEQLVDAQKLQSEMGTASKYIRSHVDIYRRMGAGPVPKLIFAKTVMTGEMTSPETLVSTIMRQPE